MIDSNGHRIDLGPTMQDLSISLRIRRRPVLTRAVKRLIHPHSLEPPTEAEKRDAIEVLREGSWYDDPSLDFLYREAERVLHEADEA